MNASKRAHYLTRVPVLPVRGIVEPPQGSLPRLRRRLGIVPSRGGQPGQCTRYARRRGTRPSRASRSPSASSTKTPVAL